MVQEVSKAIGVKETEVDLNLNLSGEDLAQGIGKLLGTEKPRARGY